MHPQILRELADEVVKPLSITLDKSWLSDEVPWTEKSPFLKRRKRKTQGITGWSGSPLCMARLWSRSSGKYGMVHRLDDHT